MRDPLEQKILATIVAQGQRALEYVPDLSTADFDDTAERSIFAACARVAAEGMAIDLQTVYAELEGDAAALHVLAGLGDDGDAPLPMLPAYVRKLRVGAALRRAIRAGREIAALASSKEPQEANLATAQRLAQAILEGASAQSDSLISLREVADQRIAVLKRISAGEPGPELIGSGITDVDRLFGGGWEPGMLVVPGGETSSGKTAFVTQTAVHNARRGVPVVFVTSEMPHAQMLSRMVAALSGMPLEKLTNARMAAEAGAGAVFARFGDLPIWFQRSFPPRIEEAVTAIRTAKARHGIKLAVIDYAQRLADHDEDSQEQAIARIAHEAKNLALELGIVVIAAAQVNRQISHRTDPRPKLADLRGSGRLEQDADVVLFTHQPARHGKPGDPEIIVAKNRNGRLGTVKVHFRGETCTFHGLEEAVPDEDRRAS